jgi:hypothetical protein
MELDHAEAAAHFAEEPKHDIWNTPAEEEDDEADTPAFLRRRKKHGQGE